MASSTITGTFKNSNNSGAVSGSLVFSDSSTKPSSTTTHSWSFTPSDTSNYNVVSGTITVTLNKTVPDKSAVTVTATDIYYGQTLASSTISYTGNFTNSFDSSTVTGTIAFTSPSTKP